MNIIIEGIDNSGKTTLSRKIRSAIGVPIFLKESGPNTFENVIGRIERYLEVDSLIFDRHPMVSQPIYGMLRKDPPIPTHFKEKFIRQNNIFIYCRCIDKRLDGHDPSLSDTPEHLKAIDEHYSELLQLYDIWAFKYAHIIYRKYSDIDLVVKMLKGIANECR